MTKKYKIMFASKGSFDFNDVAVFSTIEDAREQVKDYLADKSGDQEPGDKYQITNECGEMLEEYEVK